MLFNSAEYILLFLPVAVAIYFALGRVAPRRAGHVWLLVCSLFFYGWWDVDYLALIASSVVVNFVLGARIAAAGGRSRGPLALGVAFNLGLLGAFKYADFAVANANELLGAGISLPGIVLPLAISFFTFQQIAYLVDSHRGLVKEHSFLRYAVFVTFFPQLIAGPIVHHKEMMPQFADAKNARLDWGNVARGLYVFTIGLGKKVLVADTFAAVATSGFDSSGPLSFWEAWAASLSYTLQIYFDFSGYTDMAIGAARMFNVALPLNFASPYKATDIREFWARWHMTLSRFLRDYLYIPLGGNRRGRALTYRNLILTFLLGGLWHGAGWTFVAWGLLHGLAVAAHRGWSERGLRMNRWLAWFLTFQFVNLAWVFFRATSFEAALRVLRAMFGLEGLALPAVWMLPEDAAVLVPALAAGLLVVALARNSNELGESFRPSAARYAFVSLLFALALAHLNAYSEFLYFNF